jgi:hypothetical protein
VEAGMAIKVHLSKVRPNAFGGTTYTTLCNRMSGKVEVGMNCTTEVEEVTCKFCLRLMTPNQP